MSNLVSNCVYTGVPNFVGSTEQNLLPRVITNNNRYGLGAAFPSSSSFESAGSLASLSSFSRSTYQDRGKSPRSILTKYIHDTVPRRTDKRQEALSFIQCNLQKGRPSTTELNKWEYDIALVQEPNVNKEGKINLLQLPRRSFSKGQARAAVVINNDIDFWPVESLSSRDLAVVALELEEHGILMIASAYCDITLKAPNEEMVRLAQICKEGKLPLIIGCDSNAHSPIWGEMEENSRGSLFSEWIVGNDIHILNVGRVPTFQGRSGSRSTIIDITLTNDSEIIKMISNWKVDLTEKSLSDHRLIKFQLGAGIIRKEKYTRAYGKTNWEVFTKELSKLPAEEILDAEDMDGMADMLEDHIDYVLDVLAPKKIRRINSQNVWWNDSLSKLRRELRNVLEKSKTDHSLIDKYHSLKKDYAFEIRKAKRESWRSFCSKAESVKDISKIVQILDNPPRRMMSLMKADGKILDPGDSAKQLIATHYPDGVIGGCLQDEEPVNDDDRDFTGICQYISSQKVKMAFKSFGDNKAPGPDEYPPIVLKNLDDKHLLAVEMIYKLSLASGRVPRRWKQMRVVFIPKVGKADYASPKAYRPITLSNFLLKGLERLIQWYIKEYVIPRPLYRQHAYTQGRSCDSALSTFVDEVERYVHNGKYVLAVSLDCSGAFDCIKFSSARKGMDRHKIPINIKNWYSNLLENRMVTADVQGQKITVRPARGSPQGGVLSPLIWNLIMDTLLSTFKNGPVKVLGYADDVLVYVAGPDPATLELLLQAAINRVLKWGHEHGLCFNPNKTAAMLFSKYKKNIVYKPNLTMSGEALELCSSFRYLGVDIQRDLGWNTHVTNRTNKCKYLLAKCRNIVSKSWGLTPEKMEWVYKAVVRPKITYGSVVWAAGLNKHLCHKLNKIQRLALLGITQPIRSTPTAGLENMVGWMPLKTHAAEIGFNTYLRLKDDFPSCWGGIGKNGKSAGHRKLWQVMEDSFGLLNYPTDISKQRMLWVKENSTLFDLSLSVYTDASKEEEHVGYGWVACEEEYVIEELYDHCLGYDIYHAEMIAIKEALTWIRDNISERNVTIYSDSQSAVSALNGHVAKDTLTWDTMMLMSEVRNTCKLDLIWIKGHSDITGNEIADMLSHLGANLARNVHYVRPFVKVSQKARKKRVHVEFLRLWQKDWDSTENCVISSLFLPEVKDIPITGRFSIKELQQLSHIMTGHGLYKRHLRHWNDIGDPSCVFCGEALEDSWHLWEYCPALQEERRTAKKKIEMGMALERALLQFFGTKKLRWMMASNEAFIKPG